MTATDISSALTALFVGTLTVRDFVDFNDWAVNTVRDYCAARGYDVAALVAEEDDRITDHDLDLAGYLHARRIGSHFRLDRRTRRAVYAAVMTTRYRTSPLFRTNPR